MEGGPHRRMDIPHAEPPAPHYRPAPVHTGSHDGLHRGDASPGPHGDDGSRQHCRDTDGSTNRNNGAERSPEVPNGFYVSSR